MPKFLWACLGFIVALGLLLALYKAGIGGTSLAFFILVAGFVGYNLVKG